MNKKSNSLLKHLDFILLDFISLQIAFLLGYLVYGHFTKLPYTDPDYLKLDMLMTLGQLFACIACNTFKGVLARGYYKEFSATFKHVLFGFMVTTLVLFSIKVSATYSRVTMGLMYVFYLFVSYGLRLLYKKIGVIQNKKRALFVIASNKAIDGIKKAMLEDISFTSQYEIVGTATIDTENEIVITGKDTTSADDLNHVLEYICREWVDAVYLDYDTAKDISDEFMNSLYEMGITIYQNIDSKTNSLYKANSLISTNGHIILTSSINYLTPAQKILKRTTDIIGGIVGCIFTGILLLIVVPFQQKESKGPVFFNQERIGQNGKRFKMYKIRSMYLDAEERKKELLAQNTMSDNMMFKLDWDPRIIGNKTLPDGTRKTGIGDFIRKTSIDEFPQFLNVLKGDMSLVGTRPPTTDEWEKYQNHHRARLAMKPGITGMWQVSGRSEITDFEEVVKLDTEYIRNWTPGMDFRILMKTVQQVLKREGAK